jgi:hypothetical protein
VLIAPADVERFIANLRERGETIAPAPAAELELESAEPAPVRE